MDYNKLKDIQKNERKYGNLTKVPVNFYEECADYFWKLENNDFDMLGAKKYNNAFSCYTEIVERRLNKITEKAYFLVLKQNRLNRKPITIDRNDDILPPNILKTEEKLFYKILNNYNDFYKDRYVEYSNIHIEF